MAKEANDQPHAQAGRPSGEASYDRPLGDVGDRSSGSHGTAEDLKAAEEGADAKSTRRSIALNPEQAKQLEKGINLYSPGGQKRLRGLKIFEKHKKGFAAGGAAGLVAMIMLIVVWFLLPNFRIPSAMSLITSVVGEAAEEIVENRAQRMIISYLISKAGGNPSNYVIDDSLLGTLWKTFQTNKLEAKIERQTGIKLERGGDGVVRVVHDGRDLGDVRCSGASAKKCVDDVTALLNSTPRSQADLRKLVRLSVPAWQFHKASKYAKYLRLKYGIPKYGTPDKDDTKSNQENLEELRTQQIDLVLQNTLSKATDAFGCIIEDKNCHTFNENNEPIDTSQQVDIENPGKSTDQVTQDLQEAGAEARTETIENGGSFTERLTEKLIEKLIGKGGAKVALKAIPVVGWIDFASMINHWALAAASNQIAARIPSVLAAAATGAMYAQWQGYGDQVKAGRMDILFIGALTAQMNGQKGSTAPMAAAYKFAGGEDPATGVPVETRIESNLKSPRDELMSTVAGIQGWVNPLEWWYKTIGWLFRQAEDFIAWIATPATTLLVTQFENAMNAAFGEGWQEKLMTSVMAMVFKLLAISVDPMAQGAKLFNQLYAGGDEAFNSYARTNLGARALSQVFDRGFLWTPVGGFGYDGPSQDDKQDLAALPLKQRLFSQDEPYSLLNTTVRSMPATNDPGEWIASVPRMAASIPTKLLAIFSGNASAGRGSSPEEKASIAGVRQYGATAQDLDQDIATEVRQQPAECPDNNPEEYFNLCQADKEVIGSLMCVYTDCPEFQDTASVGSIGRVSGEGNSQQLAQQLLDLAASQTDPKKPGISFVFPYAKQDLETVARGEKIACMGGVTLSPALLQILLQAAQSFNIGLGFFVTQHCDSGQHPIGNAVDIDAINGSVLSTPDVNGGVMHGISASTARAFMETVSRLMPEGRGGLGQAQCQTLAGAQYAQGVVSFNDVCHHFHVDVR